MLADESAADDVHVQRRVGALETCLDSLSDQQRQLLELRYTSDLSVAEIAKRVDRKPAGVSTTLYRVRGVLADCIENKLDERGPDS